MEIILNSPKHGNKVLLIDKGDFKRISKYKWSVALCKGIFYATCTRWVKGKYKTIKIHRVIMGVIKTPKILIDHKNRNGLDNRKKNLRKSTHAQNACNTAFLSKSNTGFRGVYLYKKGTMAGCCTSTLFCKRKKIHGGWFRDPIEAAKKYNELAIKYHGEFARLNVIP